MKNRTAKKIALFVLAVAVAAVLSITIAACSAKDAKGTYKFQSMTMTAGGQTQTYEVGKEGPMGSALTADYYVLEIKDEGKLTITMMGGGSTDGTWTQDGNKVTLTIEGRAQEATLNGDILSISYGDSDYTETINLKRQ